MIDLIFNLIMPVGVSIKFEWNPLMNGISIIVTKNGFYLAQSINKYELERMDETSLYNIIKNLVCRLLYEEQKREAAKQIIEESNIKIKVMKGGE